METKQEACPKCQEKGRDTRGDNLIRYPDGHAHCFACTYHEWQDRFTCGFMDNQDQLAALHRADNNVIQLPKDASKEIDYQALTWLAKYEITSDEVRKYQMRWSPSKKMLIFPLYASETSVGSPMGKLLGWQARVFNPAYQSKYYKVGGFREIFHVMNLSNSEGHDLIIVEGFLDAVKIARRYAAMPLFGSSLNAASMKHLENYAEDLTFWLDEDKADKGMELARTATMLGFRAKFVITKHDPKEYNDEQIKDTLDPHG